VSREIDARLLGAAQLTENGHSVPSLLGMWAMLNSIIDFTPSLKGRGVAATVLKTTEINHGHAATT
jgi:hypothetical protein